MNLLQSLRISGSTISALAGAGGKTTAMFQIARELTPPVIVTSTTHLGEWQIPLADKHIITESPSLIEEMEHELNGVILITGPIEKDKTTPISESLLSWLREYCGYHDLPLLIEADGSRQKPIKAPDENEPAIPEFVDQVVYVAGLSGLGKPLDEENVHRSEIFSRLSGLDPGETITPDSLVRVLTHSEGGLKNVPGHARRILLLNQADTPELQSIANGMSRQLLSSFHSVIIASLKEKAVHAACENIAGIVLAAGGSSRFGQPKPLLDWRGQPFVRVITQTALAAGLTPVVIVTGSNAEEVENAIRDLDVKIVRNKDWQNGQSSSVKAGVKSLPENAGACLFLLADQPQIRVDVIRTLMEVHARELCPIIAPLVLEERRANPVLFDRVTFHDLLEITGDVGGRAIFDKHKVEYLPWHDDRLLLDVDRPEDYHRLVEDETL